MTYSDAYLRAILQRTTTIALVGYSANPSRASHRVAHYLHEKGYRVIPINPGLAGQKFHEQTIYADMKFVPDDVDFVDIFRRSEAVPQVVNEALARWPALKTIWMQLEVVHEGAAKLATARGVDVVQDRCPKIEIERLFWASPKPQHV